MFCKRRAAYCASSHEEPGSLESLFFVFFGLDGACWADCVVFHQNCVCPKGESTGVFPAVLNAFAAKHHGDQVLIDHCVLVVDRQTAPRRVGLARFHPTESRVVQKLVWIVPGLVVLNILHVTMAERHVSFVVSHPRRKVIVRQLFAPLQRHKVDGSVRLGVHYLAENLAFHSVVSECCLLQGCWVIGFVCKPVWICIVSSTHMNLPSCLIHLFDECANPTVGCGDRLRLLCRLISMHPVRLPYQPHWEVFCEHHGGVVATW